MGYLLDLIHELIKVLKKSEEIEENTIESPKNDDLGILKELKSTPEEQNYISNNYSNYYSENKKESGNKYNILNNFNSNKSDLLKNLNDNSLLNFDTTKLSEKGYTYLADKSTSKNTHTVLQKSITNSQIKNVQEISFRKYSNDKSSCESDISILSNMSNVNTMSKKNSLSFNDTGTEYESLFPLNNHSLKNEILKEINNNVNLNNELINYKILSGKNKVEIIETVAKKIKEFRIKTDRWEINSENFNVVITKEFILSHKGEIEEIIKESFQKIKNKSFNNTKIANRMINNIKAVELIENKKYKLTKYKLKKQKEDYHQAKKNSIKQIEYVNNLYKIFLLY